MTLEPPPVDREQAVLRGLEEIGRSVSVLAHDIKNPVSAVHLALSAVADRLGEDDVEVLEGLLGRLRAIELRIRRVIGFVQALPARATGFPAGEAWREAVAARRAAVAAAGATLAEGELGVRVHADPKLVTEALGELLDNALVHGRPGGRVRFEVRVEGEEAVLVVEDDGPGLRAGVAVFEPFVTTRDDAAGLGLTTCRRIATVSGGSISAGRSELGGARVELRLPLADGPGRC